MNYLIIDENNDGNGVIRSSDKVIFVPYTLKDELVNIEILEENKKYRIGKLKNIVRKSINRKTPECPYYYECGGCNIMHMKYSYQLDFKKRKVINNLKHISNIDINNIDITSNTDFNYRNHIILSVDKNKLGFLMHNTNKIVNIDNCIISNKLINNKILEIKSFLNAYKNNNIKKISIKSYNQILINIESNNFTLVDEFLKYVTCDSLCVNNKNIYGNKSITINLNNVKYEVSSESFFQKNTQIAIKLYDYIKEKIDLNSNVLDLYCGVGSIGIYISDKCKSVLGIEEVNSAILNAKKNATINNINNISFICGKVEENIDNIKDIDTIIVDPPRVGLHKKAIKSILNIKPHKIIYVSCNSTTLARDLNSLKIDYKLKEIKLFDMFPNTHHCESITILERR